MFPANLGWDDLPLNASVRLVYEYGQTWGKIALRHRGTLLFIDGCGTKQPCFSSLNAALA
jgi:hypothetical protein